MRPPALNALNQLIGDITELKEYVSYLETALAAEQLKNWELTKGLTKERGGFKKTRFPTPTEIAERRNLATNYTKGKKPSVNNCASIPLKDFKEMKDTLDRHPLNRSLIVTEDRPVPEMQLSEDEAAALMYIDGNHTQTLHGCDPICDTCNDLEEDKEESTIRPQTAGDLLLRVNKQKG
jgi:hypothetical protein